MDIASGSFGILINNSGMKGAYVLIHYHYMLSFRSIQKARSSSDQSIVFWSLANGNVTKLIPTCLRFRYQPWFKT